MLEDLTPPQRVSPCAIRDLLLSLDEKDRTILKDALANTEVWSNKGLARALTERGLTIGESAIRTRRMKACSDCFCR
jgi:hypothetical protein